MVLVVGSTLIAVDLVGVGLLRSYLTERIDTQLNRISAAGRILARTPTALPAAVASVQRFGSAFGGPAELVTVDTDGHRRMLLDTSDGHGPDVRSAATHAGRGPYTASAMDSTVTWRVDVVTLPDGGYLWTALSLEQTDDTVNQALTVGLLLSFAALVLVAGLAAAVVRGGLRPLTRMQETAAAIAAGSITARVQDTDPHTEPGRLGGALNMMLSRISSAFLARERSEQRLRQFLADVSHELRTPLTSIRGFAELHRRSGRPPDPVLDAAMRRIEDEATRMASLVDDLLLLSDLDEERTLDRRPTDLAVIAVDTARDAHARHPDRTITVTGAASTPVRADEHRLRQVATNLVANALTHTPAGARITLRVLSGVPTDGAAMACVGTLPVGPVATFEVSDTGPGVAPEHAARIFERLYRPGAGRARTADGGAGLGLSIVAAIVTAHGGRIELHAGSPTGAIFRVLLPSDPTLIKAPTHSEHTLASWTT
jgi:two-component system OmpR family sensor kinase